MAKSKSNDTDEATEAEATETTPGARSQTHIHQGQADYIEQEHGLDLSAMSPAEIIAVAYATRNAWRKTDAYAELKAEAKEQAEQEKAERAEARAARKAEREAAKAEAEAAKGDDEKPAKKASKKKASTKRKSKAAASEDDGDDENPFD